mmetsp:Transcript_21342/g.66146  ORF Transcript_21342/g.66146 Transcript_21342/m.66146 type:complete len:218 (-) Transcript_21342:325-978(-)
MTKLVAAATIAASVGAVRLLVSAAAAGATIPLIVAATIAATTAVASATAVAAATAATVAATATAVAAAATIATMLARRRLEVATRIWADAAAAVHGAPGARAVVDHDSRRAQLLADAVCCREVTRRARHLALHQLGDNGAVVHAAGATAAAAAAARRCAIPATVLARGRLEEVGALGGARLATRGPHLGAVVDLDAGLAQAVAQHVCGVVVPLHARL